MIPAITSKPPPLETATILRARNRRLAKLIEPDGTIAGYDLAKTVDLIPHPVADLTALHRLLTRMQHRRDCAIIRAEPIDPARVRQVRRLIYDDPETGEVATLREAPRRWLALDLDSLPAPPDLDLTDIAACGQAALSALPETFQGAACIVQATASHTLKPGLRLRMWFWLARPMTGPELKRWLAPVPIDGCVFAAAQPIYTARPVFNGATDPLPDPLALLTGFDHVEPPPPEALAPPPRPPRAPLAACPPIGDRYTRRALENAVARILAAPGRHPAILTEARGLGRLVDAGLLTDSLMRQTIHAAAAAVGKDDAAEIDKIIAWAIAHPSGSTPEVRAYAR